jgi:hypothetical protein
MMSICSFRKILTRIDVPNTTFSTQHEATLKIACKYKASR